MSENQEEAYIGEVAGELVSAGLNSALEIIADGEELIPFVLSFKIGEYSDHTLVADSIDIAIENGRSLVKSFPATVSAYALVSHGEVEMEEGLLNAVVIEVGELNSDASYVVVQPFGVLEAEGEESLELIGEAFISGETDNLLLKDLVSA